MSSGYKTKDLKEAVKFLKSQDKSIKLSDYKTKDAMYNLLQSVGYDMSSIQSIPGKQQAEKMFKFMKSGGSSKRALKSLTAAEIAALPQNKRKAMKKEKKAIREQINKLKLEIAVLRGKLKA